MSKKTKERSRLKRKSDRADKKAARIRLYESYKAAGNNSKRSKERGRNLNKNPGHDHRDGDCGNIGCCRCSKIAQKGKILMLMNSNCQVRKFVSKLGTHAKVTI